MSPLRSLVAAALVLAALPAFAAKKVLPPGERIDLNRASVVELMRLPGIGRARAEAIAAHRAKGPFTKVEDVLAVKGISGRWLEKERAHLAVSPAPGAKAAAPPAPAAAAPKKK